MLQRSSPDSLVQWIQEHLGPILVAIFVFVLPAVRAAIAAKKQKDDLQRRGLDRPAQPDPDEGRRTWEDLLEGSSEAPSPPPLPAPVRTHSRVPEGADVHEESLAEESLEEHRPPPMVALPSGSATESADESEVEEYVAARERQESERQEQVAAAQYAAASPFRPEVAPRPASAVPTVTLAKPPVPGAAETWLFPTGPARNRAAALRRAIVLREVLGPPLSLR